MGLTEAQFGNKIGVYLEALACCDIPGTILLTLMYRRIKIIIWELNTVKRVLTKAYEIPRELLNSWSEFATTFANEISSSNDCDKKRPFLGAFCNS